MRYVLGVVFAYVTALIALTAGAQYLAHAHPRYRHVPVSVSGPYELVIDRYAWLPLGLNGHGRAPGEVSALNARGYVVDSERLDNVLSVGNVRWDQFAVHFTYEKDGKLFESTLALEP